MGFSDYISYKFLYQEYLHKKRTGKSFCELDREIEIKDEIESLISSPDKLAFYLYEISHNKDFYINEKVNYVIADIFLVFEKLVKAENELSELRKEIKKLKTKK